MSEELFPAFRSIFLVTSSVIERQFDKQKGYLLHTNEVTAEGIGARLGSNQHI